ncbi:hypothetical protein E1B28_004762 [Marasmius oreades]|uniref:Uncharacterized protein n=1 Tax=Marasmius oreades TaxID=181124 RepID=A0A9P7UZH3_9AGAR|nr:uncharacterized protein E1B28_004762 [Marasmius oreades]KAG7097415.1 hypothetical protein E1B28_004762 [Marasmius oreades]
MEKHLRLRMLLNDFMSLMLVCRQLVLRFQSHSSFVGSLVYENPMITTTSRAMLSDVYRFSRQFNAVNVPRPLAVIYTLFGLKPPEYVNKPLLHALRAWSEIGDISEAEGFDGNRKTIVEHTLHVLFLPGLHTDSSPNFGHSTDSLLSPPPNPTHPGIRIPGTSLNVPSPLHFRLHVITRLVFNEQGRITHHRDFWDVRDVMRLIPGVPLAQWIGSRVAGLGLTYIARAWMKGSENPNSEEKEEENGPDGDIEQGPATKTAHV